MENSQGQLGGKKTIKNIVIVAISNLIKLLSGILVGFLLPKIIGVSDYGFYKTFTLYATYVGVFQFGIEDGIYLKFGGKSFEELKKSNFRFYSIFLFVLEIVSSLIVLLVSLTALSGDLKFIFVCIAVYLIAYNITGYYQFISQITSRFKELSFRNVVQSALTIVAIVSLWIVHHFKPDPMSYKIYTILFVAIQVLLTFWYIFTYRSITFGKFTVAKQDFKDIGYFAKIGIPLMIANLSLLFIMNVDRQFVNVLFDNETYAVYAFAYNMLSLITIATSAISTVLYPTLKNTNESLLTNSYGKLINVVLIFVSACLLVYFPLCGFVEWFLPKYVDSLPIFRIILPGLAISSAITIVMHNYYKTFGKNHIFFIISLGILALSIGANFAAYYLFKTTISISIASIIVLTAWYFVSQIYFIVKHKVSWIKNTAYLFIVISSFYGITFIKNYYIGLAIYFALFVLITYLFNYKLINEKIIEFKNKHSKDGDSTNNQHPNF